MQNLKETAKHLKVSERTLRNYVARRLIPFYRIGRSLRFNTAEIDQYIERNCKILPR